ncbi:MAG: hypothetical protein GW839_00400 [Flavobacteriales bacterium]|nr:hypothetical protein [Flavobacteriales bacterium]NCP89586.1 hypothetical protein [Flavobacteriales bacterium]NCQ13223.1 hypothetical protein [Flavobacteriales bacterium]
MKTDANKNITAIQYNYLNLPTQVTINGQNILYVYDATGVKLRKTVNSVTTDYAGNFIYENNVLQFFTNAEGYFEPSSPPLGELEGAYVYQYKDHLGNIRLSYSDANHDGSITASTEIKEENNYYPFGLKHKGYNNVIVGTENNYQTFNGQELEEELGKNTLAFQWRDYDPAIGRFNKIDRFAEKYYSVSNYAFTANNPIFFSEVKGDSLDVSTALKQDRKALTTIVKDLQSKTGLTFTLKDGKLVYKKDADGNAIISKDADGNDIGSSEARGLVTGALNNSKIVNLEFGEIKEGSGVSFETDDGQQYIALDPTKIQGMIDGSSKGLNNTTFGFAMTLMHEIDHTDIGLSKTGHGAESTTFGLTGTVVDRMNKIRRQLGSSYGQRMSYASLNSYGSNYIPFSSSSLSILRSNPTPGIVWTVSNSNSEMLNQIYKTIKY